MAFDTKANTYSASSLWPSSGGPGTGPSGSPSGSTSSSAQWWGNIIGAGIGAFGSIYGASSANQARKDEAEQNRKFQERMSSTSHQREVLDLKAAGLNPILSATGGKGASSPAGNMADQKDIMTPALSSAVQMARLAAELANLRANTRNTNAQAQSTENTNVPGDIKAGWISRAYDWLKEAKTDVDARGAARKKRNDQRASDMALTPQELEFEPTTRDPRDYATPKQGQGDKKPDSEFYKWREDFHAERNRWPTPQEAYRYYWKYH